jgi:hypothetical protein
MNNRHQKFTSSSHKLSLIWREEEGPQLNPEGGHIDKQQKEEQFCLVKTILLPPSSNQ